MNTSTPIVSVLMTAYNREKYIAQAIESVLASSYQHFELIIVDDGSKDATVAIARTYEAKDHRVKVYQNEKNLGDYPNRNKAASYANGKYIKYLDSDDIMYEHCLQVMVGAMEKFPEAGFGLSCLYEAAHPYPRCISSHDAYMEHFYGFRHFDRAPGSSIIKKASFDAVGGFSGQRMIGDNELWLTLGRNFPLVKFPPDLYWSRMHEGQESQTDYAKQYDLLRKKVFNEAFAHPGCPLNEEEKKAILAKMKKDALKTKILKLVR
ncbi:MAG TPA: glycosyltransferase family 2 protein [Flavipsychrobacter sp.]|nr:glycosyltransferase family 2 protein [Flavipsychrobacter sp.]